MFQELISMSSTMNPYTQFNLPSDSGAPGAVSQNLTSQTLDSKIQSQLLTGVESASSLIPNPSSIIPNLSLSNLQSQLSSSNSSIPTGVIQGVLNKVQGLAGSIPGNLSNVTSGLSSNLSNAQIGSLISSNLSPGSPTVVSSGSTPTGISEPAPTPQKAIYGKIQTFQNGNQSGLILDETSGNERVILQHQSGSYDSTLPDGSKVDKSVKDRSVFVTSNSYRVINQNETSIISQDHTSQVNQNEKVKIGNNKSDNIQSDYSINVGNNLTITVGSNGVITISGNGQINASGNITISASGNLSLSGSSISLN